MTTEADKLAELLPCPFCGCDDFETSPFPHNRDRTIWAVVCGNPDCNAELLDNSPAGAIARWNRRAPSKPMIASNLREIIYAEQQAANPAGTLSAVTELTDDQIADLACKAGWDVRYEDLDGNETNDPHLLDEEGCDSFDCLRKLARTIASHHSGDVRDGMAEPAEARLAALESKIACPGVPPHCQTCQCWRGS